MVARVASLGAPAALTGKLLLYGLHVGTSLTLKEIAGLTGAKSATAVAQAIHRLRSSRASDTKLDQLVIRLEALCRGGRATR